MDCFCTQVRFSYRYHSLIPLLSVVRRVVVAFRVAAESTRTLDEAELRALPYRITSAVVFNEIMYFCLKTMDTLFEDLLPGLADQKAEAGKRPSPSAHPKWKTVRSLVKGYLHSVLLFVGELTETSMLVVVCRHLERLAPYLVAFPGLARNALKTLLHLWTSEQQDVRVAAFLASHALTVNHTPAFFDDVLKAAFLTYFRNSKFVNGSTRPVIAFLRVAVVTMYGSGDFATAYQHAFVYIRELAIHLRTALTSKSKDAIARVYSWQYLHSLHLWTDLLVQHPNQPALRHLFYPLIQILSGVVGFVAGLRYTPFRLQCIRMMNRLAEAGGQFVNNAPSLLDLLEHSDLARKSPEGRLKVLNLEGLLKLPKSTTMTKLFKDRTVALVLELLMQNLATFSHSIAFPELAYSINRRLKRYISTSKVPPFSKQAKKVSNLIAQNNAWIEEQRKKVTYAPKDTKSVVQFSQDSPSPLKVAWAETAEASRKQQAEWAEMEEEGEGEEGDSDGEVDLEVSLPKKDKRKHEDGKDSAPKKVKTSKQDDEIAEDAVTDLQFSDEESE